MGAFELGERIEQLFAGDLRIESSLGLAARLGISEDEALVELVGLVTSGALVLVEEGNLLLFLTPDYANELELAA